MSEKNDKLAIKFFPDQDYVPEFFGEYLVAFSAPSVFNDCFEAYLLPSKENESINIDLQVLIQSPESALCFCCSKLNNYNLTKSEFELLWSHYASEHRGIGVIFDREEAFSKLEKNAEPAFNTTDATKSISAKYQYNYTGFDVQYLKLKDNNYNQTDFFVPKESTQKFNHFDDLIQNFLEKPIDRQEVYWQKVFAKNIIWQYEDEYRYVIERHSNFKKVVQLDKYLVPMNKDSIKGIVFANRFQKNEAFARKIINKILKSHEPKKLSYFFLRKSTTKKQLETIDTSSIN